jgi:hypothetical protein
MPPITPGSAVSVIRSMTCSSAATAATPSGMPMPRFTTRWPAAPARRAMILRRSSPIGSMALAGTRISALKAGL